MKSVDLLFDYLTPSLPRRWRHFCVVYKEEGQSASVFQVTEGDDDKDVDKDDDKDDSKDGDSEDNLLTQRNRIEDEYIHPRKARRCLEGRT